MAEGVLRVGLFELTFVCNSHGCKEANSGLSNNRVKAVSFGPCGGFQVAENYNATFGAIGDAKCILFDSQDTHGWNGFATFVVQGLIFGMGQDVENIFESEGVVFLGVGVKPNGAVRVVTSEGLPESSGGGVSTGGGGYVKGVAEKRRLALPTGNKGAFIYAVLTGEGEVIQ